MIQIPSELKQEFESFLTGQAISTKFHTPYLKWLRYYLDFCHKYHFPKSNPETLLRFIQKLEEKNQTETQKKQAEAAISLYYQYLQLDTTTPQVCSDNPTQSTFNVQEKSPHYHTLISETKIPTESRVSNTVDTMEQSTVQQKEVQQNIDSWKNALTCLSNEIKVRHYSPKTLKSYSTWIRKLQKFIQDQALKQGQVDLRPPESLSSSDVKEFLTFLAVEQKVSVSSQNQAFNALLFLFRHVLNKEFGQVDGVVRAKQKPYIPVVLSRDEIENIVKKLRYPYNLIAKLLYGCGLRLSECLKLRVQDFNFDAEVITIHDGKGQKDRTVPLPEKIFQELLAHLERVKNLHRMDLAEEYAGTFVPGNLERKYKDVGKELIWQWFFPAKTLTYVPETKEYRRYHLHETHVQRAIKSAVKRAKITKRASAHTFRHSFASHLLQANYDIRTIQTLLGHRNVRTTMIYTHTIKTKTLKDAKSPLDL